MASLFLQVGKTSVKNLKCLAGQNLYWRILAGPKQPKNNCISSIRTFSCIYYDLQFTFKKLSRRTHWIRSINQVRFCLSCAIVCDGINIFPDIPIILIRSYMSVKTCRLKQFWVEITFCLPLTFSIYYMKAHLKPRLA